MTVLANASSYFGSAGVLVSGVVNPAPNSSGYWVAVRVISPNDVVVFVTEVPISSGGLFNASFAAGASIDKSGYSWMNGTYKVYAYHEGGTYAVTIFQWSGPSPTITTTTTYTETSSYQTNTTQEIKDQIQNYLCGLHPAKTMTNCHPAYQSRTMQCSPTARSTGSTTLR
jgi:hypothetical protein